MPDQTFKQLRVAASAPGTNREAIARGGAPLYSTQALPNSLQP